MESLYRVFLVEDSAAIRETLTQSLESAGLVKIVGHAETAEDAWQLLRQTPSDAVVIDLHLRNGTGFDFLARLKTEPQLSPLVKIVLTNYATKTFRDRCVLLGAQHFFDKSLEFDRVIDLLNTLAEKKTSGEPAA
jgi:DNA-binding NarL/FixJ family response regulator